MALVTQDPPDKNPLALYVNHAQAILDGLQSFDGMMAMIKKRPKGLAFGFVPVEIWPAGQRIRDKISASELPISAAVLPLFQVEQFGSDQKPAMDGVLNLRGAMTAAGLPGWTVRCIAAMHKLYLHVAWIHGNNDDGAKVRMLTSKAHNPTGLAKFAADLERLEIFSLEAHTVIYGTVPPAKSIAAAPIPSRPMHKKEIAAALSITPKALNEAINNGMYIVEKYSRKTYQIHIESFPPAQQAKFI